MKETVKLKLGIGSSVEVQSEGEWRQGRVVVLRGEVVQIQYEGGELRISVHNVHLCIELRIIASFKTAHFSSTQGVKMKTNGYQHLLPVFVRHER